MTNELANSHTHNGRMYTDHFLRFSANGKNLSFATSV